MISSSYPYPNSSSLISFEIPNASPLIIVFVFLLLTWVTPLLVRFAIEEGDSTLSSWALHLDFKQQEIFFFISTTLKQRSKEDMKCKIVLHHLLTTRSSCNPTSCSRGRCWGALKLVFSFMKTIYVALLVNNIYLYSVVSLNVENLLYSVVIV